MKTEKNEYTEILYTPAPAAFDLKNLFTEILQELINARGLAWRLFVRNLNAMYRQTYFGYVWMIVPPLTTAIIFIFLRSQRVIDVEIENYPYSIYVITGVLVWQSFVESINSPLKMLNGSVSFIGKINFPKVALIMAGFGEVAFNSLIRCTILVIIYQVYGIEYGSYAIFAPLSFLSLILFGFAIGIIISPVGMLFKDVEKGTSIVTYMWFFLTPVFYTVPDDVNLLYIYLNPVTPILVTIREMLIGNQLSYFYIYLLYSLLSALALLPGLVIYRLSMPYVIERVET